MTATSRRRSRPHFEGDPTLAKVMRKPKWIGALFLALLVAGGFAWLSQWQLSHAITIESEHAVDTETSRVLNEESGPGLGVTDQVAGAVLETSGSFVAGDFDVVEQRSNGGKMGAWVVGHLVTDDASSPGHLAVALGWAADADQAGQTLEIIESNLVGEEIALEGRYMPADSPVKPEASDDPNRLLSMSPAQLVNRWQPFDGPSYAGYLVLHPNALGELSGYAESGLESIDSVAPLPVETVNWLNVFYAIEWVVFAGFAVFFWYRLARDDWEKTHEQKLLDQANQQSHPELHISH